MPAHRPLTSLQEQQEAENLQRENRNRLERINQELTLYDPLGAWRFFEERLKNLEARYLTALETGPIEEVEANRKVLKVIRDLLAVPADLVRTRELLEGDMNG